MSSVTHRDWCYRDGHWHERPNDRQDLIPLPDCHYTPAASAVQYPFAIQRWELSSDVV